jgi:hypothetical protein
MVDASTNTEWDYNPECENYKFTNTEWDYNPEWENYNFDTNELTSSLGPANPCPIAPLQSSK